MRTNEVNITQFSGIVDLRFFDCPLLLLCVFRRVRHVFPISGHKVSGVQVICFPVCLLPDHENPSGGLSSETVNLVEPVHVTDISQSPSTFQ